MKIALLPLLVLTLAGCLTVPERDPIIVTQKVEVPVVVKCVLSYPKEPSSEVEQLPLDASLYSKIRAALMDLEGQRQYSKELKAVMQKCAEDKKILD